MLKAREKISQLNSAPESNRLINIKALDLMYMQMYSGLGFVFFKLTFL